MAEIQVTQPAPEPVAADRAADRAGTGATAGAQRAPSAPPSRFSLRSTGLSRRTLLQGFAGSLLLLIGMLGAGGDLIHDPVIGDGPLSAIRYGHGRNLAMALAYIGVGLLVWAWVRLGREVIADKVRGRGVLVAAFAWIAPMVVSPPAFTRDVFSYLGQGKLSALGLDPYAVGPNVLGDAIAMNVHPFWQATPAPYGPLFILLAKWVSVAIGEHLIAGVILMRLVLMIGLVLLVLAQPRLTRWLGGKLSVALWLSVASPMMVIHLVGGPHNDLLMIGLLAMGTLLVLERKHAAGIALVTLGMAVKATAGVALPFLVWVWAARLEGTLLRRFVRAAAAGIGVVIVVFGATMLIAQVNFGWISALSAPMMIVNWVNLPTGIGELTHGIVNLFGSLPEQPFDNMFRLIGDAVLLVILVRQWWLARHGGPEAVRRMALALVAVAILAPPTLPWYLTWGLAVLGAAPWRKRWLCLVAGLAVLILLVYYPNGEGAMGDLVHMVFVVLFAVLAMVSMTKYDPLKLRQRLWGLPPKTDGSQLAVVPSAELLVDPPEVPDSPESVLTAGKQTEQAEPKTDSAGV
jgi:alpha-1,6-mannosyltransferase